MSEQSFSAVFCEMKRMYFSVLAHISISQKRQILTEIDDPPSSCKSKKKTSNCSRMQWLFAAVFHALKRLYFSVLAHIIMSQND
jgi:hypothetical protein